MSSGGTSAWRKVSCAPVLGVDGPVELDWDTLLTYDGQGHCEKVQCGGETGVRYRDQLATWGENMGWHMNEDSHYVEIHSCRCFNKPHDST